MKKSLRISFFLMLCLLLPSCASLKDEKDLIRDEELDSNVRPSINLDEDKMKMWKLVKMQTIDDTGKVTYLVSPVSAINAAARVMESEKNNLIGLSLKDILQRLKNDPNHRKGSYNFPFWPIGKDERAIVFRFDCGCYGWQFDLLLDKNDKVKKIRRQWIE